jgi:hypothetical protein
MRHKKIVTLGLAATAGLFLTLQQAEAQRRYMVPHGGRGMGAFHGGHAFRGGSPGFRGGMIGAGPRFNAGPRYAVGPGVGNNWRRWQGHPGYWNNGYGWRRNNNNYWGYAGAGLIGGLAIGALASSYPYDNGYGYGYDAGAYSYPVSGGFGNYCQTSVKTCQLYDPAAVGVGCSCRVPGGRAGGVVVP